MAFKNPQEAREVLLGDAKRQDVLLGAIARYNSRISVIAERLQRYPEESRRAKIVEGISSLDRQIEAREARMSVSPSDTAQRQELVSRESNRILLENILRRVDSGEELPKVLEQLPEPSRINSYERATTFLREHGLIIDVDSRADVGKSIRSAADYQIVLLARQFEIPDPFSQNLIKEPSITNDEAFVMCLDHLVDRAVRENIDSQVRTMVATRFGAPPYSGKKAAQARVYEQRLRVDGDIQQRAAAYEEELRTSRRFVPAAEDIVSDLMQFVPVHLVPSRKSRRNFESRQIIPDELFRERIDGLSEELNYLTMTFRGFDQHHAKVMLMANNSVGMRLCLYSELARDFLRQGQRVSHRDVVVIRKPYAHGAEGDVMSRSGLAAVYNCAVTHMADFDPSVDESRIAYIHSLWPDIAGDCHCKDRRFMGEFHQKKRYDFYYFCMHLAALGCAYIQREIDHGRQVLSPFIFPLDEQIDFEQRLSGQVLVVRKETGEVKTLNRGEREWLCMVNISERGYDFTCTADFSAAKAAVKRMYGV